MKTKEYTGISINEDEIVGLTGHIEDNLLIIDDSLCMKRKGSVSQDLAMFIQQYSLQNHRLGIVCNCPTFTNIVPFNGDIDCVADFIKWNLNDLIPWTRSEYTYDFCLRKDDCENTYIYIVAIHRKTLDEINKAISRCQAIVSIIDYWPIPLAYLYTYRNGFITGIVREASIQLWCWWKSVCIKEITVYGGGKDLVEAVEGLEEDMKSYGIVEVQGLKIYGTEQLAEEMHLDINAMEEAYGLMEAAPFHITSRGSEAFIPGEIDWDMALGVLIRGLNYVDGNR